MNRDGYRLVNVAATLDASGIPVRCLLRSSGRWIEFTAGALPPEWFFLGAAIDSRSVVPGQIFVGLLGERVDGRDHIGDALAAGAVAILTREWDGPGGDPLKSVPAVDGSVAFLTPEPRAALGVLAAEWRRRMAVKMVGITGSNGKTTTKDMLAAMLGAAGPCHATAGNLNNELGLPLTLLGLRREHIYAVIEMGASAPGEIAGLAALAAPVVGVITNAAPAHLEGFGSIEAVINAKGELLDALPPGGSAILNADSPGFERWLSRSPCTVISWGREAGDNRWNWDPLQDPSVCRLVLEGNEFTVPVPGRHNAANLVAAILAARACGVGDDVIRSGLLQFQGSAHRGRVLNPAGVLLLDDCYNANPVSMALAARTLAGLPGDGSLIGVIGAMGELGPTSDELHRGSGEALREAGLDLVLALPGAEPLAAGFADAGGEAILCADHAAAADRLRSRARPGDKVLFKGSRTAAVEKVLDLYLADGGLEPPARRRD